MLPRCVLASPVNGGRTHWREVQRLVKTRIQRFQAGEVSELWSEALVESDKYARKRNPKKSSISLSKVNASRARRAVEEGQYRKAIQALSSSGLANVTPDVIDEMLSKHPQCAPPTIPSDPSYHPALPDISESLVLKAIRSFQSGTAPGPSCLRANHLKEAVLCPSPDRAVQALRAITGVVKLLVAGLAPQEVIPHLCGASLLPCQKKNGGLQPIAIVEMAGLLTFSTFSPLAL